MKKIFLGLLLIAIYPMNYARCEQQQVQVVVSLKPLHALVAGVMQGVAEPQLLLTGSSSPHGYVLRPSAARALSRADLIVWVGETLESFLEKPLQTLGSEARQLKLIDVLKPLLLPYRESGQWEDHGSHAGEEADSDSHLRETAELNPHLWLSPLLAMQVVKETTRALIELDPAHQAQYQQNGAALLQRLDSLHRQLQTTLAPVREIPYLVFHDAYQYFEKTYNLNAVGSLTINPERQPGAKRIKEMREKIKTLQARAVFSEPQFEPRLVATIIEGSGARRGILDPLGAALPAGEESYFQLLQALAENLVLGLRE